MVAEFVVMLDLNPIYAYAATYNATLQNLKFQKFSCCDTGCTLQPSVILLARYFKEIGMSTAVKLSDELVNSAKPYASAMHRSVTKQIEYWAKLGKTAEENPDLPVSMILDILVSMEEAKVGMLHEYSFE